MAERVVIEFVGTDGVSRPAQSASNALAGLQKAAEAAHTALNGAAQTTAAKALGEMGKQAQGTAGHMHGATTATQDMSAQATKATGIIGTLAAEYQKTGTVSKGAISAALGQMRELNRQMSTGGGGVAGLQAMGKAWQDTGKFSQMSVHSALGGLKQLAAQAGLTEKEIADIGRVLGQTGTQATTMGSRVGGALRGIAQQASSVVMGLAVFGVIQKAVSGLGNALIGLNARLEQAEMAFTTMLGSGEQAKKFLDELARFAAKTPFEFPELVDATKRLMAFGFQAKEVMPLMTSIGNAAAAMGGGAFMIQRITTALGQMSAKGKVAGQEMLQLTESGIAAWDMLAKKLGVDVARAMKMVEDRAVDARVMIEAFQEGTAARFGDMMGKQARTFEGAMSTVRDSLQMALANAFKPFFQQISAGTLATADFLSGEGFQAFAQSVGATSAKIAELILAIGGLGRVVAEHRELQGLLVVSLTAVGTAFALAGTKALAYTLVTRGAALATAAMTAAQWAWNAALAANPIGLVIVGLAALAAAVVFLSEKVETATSTWERHEAALRQSEAAIKVAEDAEAKAGNEFAKGTRIVRELEAAITARDEALADGINSWTRAGDTARVYYGQARDVTDAAKEQQIVINRLAREYGQLYKGLEDSTVQLRIEAGALREAAAAAREKASANRSIAESILRVNEIEGTPYVEQTIDDLRREQQERRRYGETVDDTAGKLETLVARTKELSQANAIYGQGSAQSRAIIAQTGGVVNQLKSNYSDLGATQRATVADAVGGFDSLVNSLAKTEEQAVKTAESLANKGLAAAAKDLSDKIRLAKGDLSQLRDVTKLYGEDSEEAKALTASLSGRLIELRGEYGDLDAVQRQQIDSLELEAQKLTQAASNFREVGFSVEQVTAALIAMHPATVAAAAQVASWRQRIADVTLAQQANSDQLRAAQKELQGMQERLSGLQERLSGLKDRLSSLNSQLSEARQRLSDLINPKLAGMGAFDKQITDLQDSVRKLEISKLTISMGGGDTTAVEAQIKALQDKLRLTELTKEDTFAAPLRQLKEAAEGTVKELTFSDALSGIAQAKSQIGSLTAAIAGQEAAIRSQESVIKGYEGALRSQQQAIQAIQDAGERLNRTLADYQERLREAEARQNLVSQALQLSYQWLMNDRVKFVELGDEGVRQAGIIDTKTQELLSSVSGAAKDTTTQSSAALGTMVEEYQKSMVQGILAVQGADGKGGLVGTNKILADSIDENTLRAQGLKKAIDDLKSKEIVITTKFVYEGSPAPSGAPSEGYPIPAVPEVGGAMGGTFRVPGFATGGAFAVGGFGAPDSQLVQFRASPGEVVNITPPGQSGAGGITWTGDLIVQGSVMTDNDLVDAIHTGLLKKKLRSGSLGF